MKLTIRDFVRSTDTSKLSAILDKIFEDDEGFKRFSNELMNINYYKEHYISEPEYNIFVAKANPQELAGFTIGKHISNYVYEIQVLYILPEFRKKGVATALKNYLIKHAESNKYLLIQSKVRNNNQAMINLNRLFGWTEMPDKIEPDKQTWFFKILKENI